MPDSESERITSVCLGASIHHATYVATGAETRLADAEKPSLGGLLMVVDADGWVTLHRVEGIYRRRGQRTVRFGPRVPWPDGRTEARNIAAYDPEFDARRRAELERS